MKKLFKVTAALAAAVAVLVVLALPKKHLALVPFDDGTVPGAMHIHTNRSDGLSGVDEIAAAAARAGLKFVVFTDHGDGTRRPDPPTYRSGVLCLDGVEISTNGGHYLAIGMPQSPYPLAGDARDVVEDVRRLGGIGIAAHPDSPKAELLWSDRSAPIDGIELMNPDTDWRRWAREASASGGDRYRWRARGRLAAALLSYAVRSPETIGSLMLGDNNAVPRWAGLATGRRVVATGGVDAHARLELSAEPHNSRFALPIPGYEQTFRTLTVHTALNTTLTGNAETDAAALLDAIRNGRLYIAVDAQATPPGFEFVAMNSRGSARPGDELPTGGPVTLRIRHNAPATFTTIVHNGTQVLSGGHHEPSFMVQAPASGVYWVEIRGDTEPHQASWLISNPIYVQDPPAATTTAAVPAATREQPLITGDASAWHAEHDPASLSAFEVSPPSGAGELRFRYGLSGGPAANQVAALAVDTPAGLAGHDRLTFTLRADRPMRVSLQLRLDAGGGAVDRWQRSVYVDATDQTRTVAFSDFSAVGVPRLSTLELDRVRGVLFVVDVTNTKPGASGRLWIKHVLLQGL